MMKYKADGLLPEEGSVVYMACPDHLAPLEASLEFSLSTVETNT